MGIVIAACVCHVFWANNNLGYLCEFIDFGQFIMNASLCNNRLQY